MTYESAFGDIAPLGHVEILAPSFEASVEFFKEMVVSTRQGARATLSISKAGDYERFTFQLTRANTSGLGHVAFRAKSAAILDQLVNNLGPYGVRGERWPIEFGYGPAFRTMLSNQYRVSDMTPLR